MRKETCTFDVKGMYCSNCATRIEKVLTKMAGIESVTINLATEQGKVTFDQSKTSMDHIIEKINKIGFEATQKTGDNDIKEADINELQWKFTFSVILTLPLAWAMLSHFQWASFIYIPPLFLIPLFQFIITIPIQFIIGFRFYERAYQALKSGQTNMDVLVVLSTSAAFFYSHYITFTMPHFLSPSFSTVLFYETSAFIITFILLGKLLEAKTKSKATEALKKLYKIQTKTASLIEKGNEKQVLVTSLLPGDRIMIKPGEKVPIDGQVIEGNSMVDEALLTGESIPIEKNIGASVYAGTINQNGLLYVVVTKKDSETTLSHIIKIVEEAQSSKAPIQHIADKITGVFVPIVIVIAIVTFCASYFLFEQGIVSSAVGKLIAVLIIACPCALGLATPTSIMVGSGRAAQSGILFKEGKILELLGKSDYVLLDKTGTITTGVPTVTNIYVEGFRYERLLELIGAVERNSDHPVAKAVVNKAKEKVRSFPVAKDVRNIPGHGIEAIVDRLNVTIANSSFYIKNNILLPAKAKQLEKAFKKGGKTVMIIFIDHRFAGVVALSDEIKSTSIQTVSRLKKMGLNVVLLTGDHRQSGVAVAHKVGIEEVYTECTPTDKAIVVKEIQKSGKRVVMVGDGINDAPALALADIGIAIGTGSDVAIESGDITIMQDDLNRLVDAIFISKKTMINIKQNFAWAFVYNIVMIPFAMFGILVPWLAGAAMAFSSISVVLNSLRLKRINV